MNAASKAAIALCGCFGAFAVHAQDAGQPGLRLDRELTYFTRGQQDLLASRELPIAAFDVTSRADLSEKARADLRDIRPDMLDGAPNVLYLRAAGGSMKAGCALVPDTLDLRCGAASDQVIVQSNYTGRFEPTARTDAIDEVAYQRSLNDPGTEVSASYSWVLAQHTAVFGYVGAPGVPALGTPLYKHPVEGLDEQARGSSADWMDSNRLSNRVVTVGYVWRALKLEGSTFNDSDEPRFIGIPQKSFGASSGRLSFSPTPNLALKISRGQRNRPDLVDPQDEIRRTTVSAVYSQSWDHNSWQTTLALGRRVVKDNPALVKENNDNSAVLLESVLRLNNAHAFFGRFERTAAGELFRDVESMYGQSFSADKFTLGYVYDVKVSGPVKLGIGALASKRFIPADQISMYGNVPASYKVFMRVQIRLQ
jgi:hypothetical protein